MLAKQKSNSYQTAKPTKQDNIERIHDA